MKLQKEKVYIKQGLVAYPIYILIREKNSLVNEYVRVNSLKAKSCVKLVENEFDKALVAIKERILEIETALSILQEFNI